MGGGIKGQRMKNTKEINILRFFRLENFSRQFVQFSQGAARGCNPEYIKSSIIQLRTKSFQKQSTYRLCTKNLRKSQPKFNYQEKAFRALK